MWLHLQGAAESGVVISQSVIGNVITDIGSVQENVIRESFNESIGIMQVNQNTGTATNQANVAAIAVGKAGFADANLWGTIALIGNTLTVIGRRA